MAEAERDLLVTAGHQLVEYIGHNDEMKDYLLGSKSNTVNQHSLGVG